MTSNPQWIRLRSISLTLLVLSAINGCASTTDCLSPAGRAGLTPAQVSNTEGYGGERQRWGGTLASVRNLPDSTEIEVIGYPLEQCGRPRTGAEPVGRFILIKPGYLEGADHPIGSTLTATGVITGTRQSHVGAAPYRFPLLKSDHIRWWPMETPQSYMRPLISVGIGGGSGGVGGGIGVHF